MEIRDSENDARLMAVEFNLTTSSSQEVDVQALAAKAKLALKLNSDAESIGFFKKVGHDSWTIFNLIDRENFQSDELLMKWKMFALKRDI